jgi:signal transduction histidine kinase
MRQRVVRVAVVAVAVALVLFAVPLAIVIRSEFFTQERGELERTALAAAVRVGPQFANGDQVELPFAQTDTAVGVYDLKLVLRAGHGPATADPITRRAARGGVADGQIGHDLVVSVPVSSSEEVVGVARASIPSSMVWARVMGAWLVLLALAAGSLVVGILVARRQARLISEPLEALSAASLRIADGDLTTRAARSDIAEIQSVAAAHNAMVSRLTQAIERERQFSANASHQLRTPLTGLQLGLDSALQDPAADLRSVLTDATRRVHALHGTVDEVLALSRLGPDQWLDADPRPIGAAISEVERRWYGPLAGEGRRLQVTLAAGVVDLEVPASLAIQILDVLLDNAFRHGRGTVTLSVRELSETLAVDVQDEGSISLQSDTVFDRGRSGGDGQGIGLAFARTMAEASGGRLVLASRSPATFTLFLSSPQTRSEARIP